MMRTLLAVALVTASAPAFANEANDRITTNLYKNLKPGERLTVNCLGDTCHYDIRKEQFERPWLPHNKVPVRPGLPKNRVSGF